MFVRLKLDSEIEFQNQLFWFNLLKEKKIEKLKFVNFQLFCMVNLIGGNSSK